jgi:hypothetical protein
MIVRWNDGHPWLERIASDVPPHRKSSGPIRHGPTARHGGGREANAGEPHRIEHLGQFVKEIAERLPAEDDLTIMGSGTVHERLARRVREGDERHHRRREILTQPSPRLTGRQLIAELNRSMGVVRRRTVGAYRWSDRSLEPSAAARGEPRRVAAKPPVRREESP